MKHSNHKVHFCLVLILFLYGLPELHAQTAVTQYGTPFKKVPDPRDVAIYQVNIRTFSEAGNFKGVTARLDDIKALGVNLIYLMPTYPVGTLKSVNSPYCIKDYVSVNPEFGNLEDLRQLVDGAHRRKMAVIMDWVANHTSYDHGWTKNKSWYLLDSLGNIVSPPNMGWNDVAQLNFSNKEMSEEMIESMKYWVLAAKLLMVFGAIIPTALLMNSGKGPLTPCEIPQGTS